MPNVNGGILNAVKPRNHADAPSDGTTVVYAPSAGRKRWKPCRSCRSSITNGSRVCQRPSTMRRWRRSCGQSAPSIWRSSMWRCPEALVGTEDLSSRVVCSRWRDAAREAHKPMFERREDLGVKLSSPLLEHYSFFLHGASS